MEDDVVKLFKLIFQKRFMDNTYIIRKCHETDTLFDALNSYHPN